METKTGTSRRAASSKAPGPQGRQSTGLSACWSRYGLLESALTFLPPGDGEFGAAYRHLEVLFSGHNPYMEAIQRNLDYLAEVLRTGRWPMLRRDPPCFTWERNPVQNIRSLVIGRLKQVWKS